MPARWIVGFVAMLIALSGCMARGRGTRVTFFNLTPDTPLEIAGTLVRPTGNGPFPAVVQLHGCAGVEEQSFRWARWLADRGYVALVVDSFGPRKVRSDCRTGPDEPPITARLDDAFGALRFLQSQPYVVRDRIGAIGWSQGGVYAMALVNGPSLERARARGVALPEIGFAAAIGVYPGGCESLASQQVVRPLMVLIGGADDWTPAEHCVRMVEAMRSRGADATIVIYPGAYHYFDKEGQAKEFLSTVENDTTPSGFGATVAYQEAAAVDAHRQVETFLARHLR
jgi:dienelactone hydrolase